MVRKNYKHSEETKRKIGKANSKSLLGNIPWNKGLTKELIEKGYKVLRLWGSEINVMSLERFKVRLGEI